MREYDGERERHRETEREEELDRRLEEEIFGIISSNVMTIRNAQLLCRF